MKFHTNQPLSFREQMLMGKINREYTVAIVDNVLFPLIDQTSPVSLRALDWAVVNWSKQHNIVCASPLSGESTNVYNSYRTSLQHWKRRLFDPFRRRSRIKIEVDGRVEDTTLGQANFVLWCYKSGVYAYVMSHIDAIDADMNKVTQNQKMLKRAAAQTGTRRKRTDLTSPKMVSCLAYTTTTCARFK